jgi:DNA repair photolyase
MFYSASMVEYRLEPCRTALNRVRGMGFNWSLNPYMGCVHRCTFCFVRAFEAVADRPAGQEYGRSIRVKTNIADVLEREVTRKRWRHELVAIGTATDPYQPAEGRFRLTRACLGVLARARNPFQLLTRGPLIVRDTDVLQEASGAAEISISFSVPTLDMAVVRLTEPGTAPPMQRLRALARLRAAGIMAGVGLAPILPGLTDSSHQLRDVVRAAHDHGAAFVWANLLYLKPGTREHFLECLAHDWPELLARYEELYNGRAYADRKRVDEVKARVRGLADSIGVGLDRRPDPPPLPSWPEQLALAM